MKKVAVLIPAYNDVVGLKETMASVQSQNYPQKNINIVIVDFGSTDGTYEAALSYCGKRIGVYRRRKMENRRQRVAEIARILVYLDLGSPVYSVVLYPGDILYPNCFETCQSLFEKYSSYHPEVLIGEVDVKTNCNERKKQEALFSKNRALDVKEDVEYFFYGYQHQALQIFKGYPFTGRFKAFAEANEQRWWKKMAWMNSGDHIIYTKEVLGCERALEYENEFDEILYRWDMLITVDRMSEANEDSTMSVSKERLEKTYRRVSISSLAHYALWRSFLLYKKNGNRLDTENCYLIAEVIDPEIKKTSLHQLMKKLLEDRKDSVITELETYFATDEPLPIE